MRTTLLLIVVMSVAACKARDSASGGLLEREDAMSSASYSAPGPFEITCHAIDSDGNRTDGSYRLMVTESGQDGDRSGFLVDVLKVGNGADRALIDQAKGSGSISADGSVMLTFGSGVLSVDKGAEDDEHVGILTLLDQSEDTEGLAVRCLVTDRSPIKATQG